MVVKIQQDVRCEDGTVKAEGDQPVCIEWQSTLIHGVVVFTAFAVDAVFVQLYVGSDEWDQVRGSCSFEELFIVFGGCQEEG